MGEEFCQTGGVEYKVDSSGMEYKGRNFFKKIKQGG